MKVLFSPLAPMAKSCPALQEDAVIRFTVEEHSKKMCLEHPPCSEHWEPLGFALSLSLYAAIAFDTQAKLLKCLKQAAQMWLILWDCTMDIEVSVVPRTLMLLCLTGYNSSCYLRDPREHQVPTILELQSVLWENTVACRGGTKKWTAITWSPKRGCGIRLLRGMTRG